jgi:hypothetical protein
MAAEAEDPAATATLEKFRLYETRAVSTPLLSPLLPTSLAPAGEQLD